MSDTKNQVLLKFQIGPVQDFIAQARSTRDLWSGSYLLSWLVTAGVGKLVTRVVETCQITSRDAENLLVFPHLEGQPLYELQRDGKHCRHEVKLCLTPNAPNLFVSLVPLPEQQTQEIAREVADAIREEWKNIAAACWNKLTELAPGYFDALLSLRFDQQIARFLSITWQITPAIATSDKVKELVRGLPIGENARKKIEACLGGSGSGASPYALDAALNSWQLDAVRQVRDFRSWSEGRRLIGKKQTKDTLTGREEAICGGAEWWTEHVQPFLERDDLDGWLTVFRERHAGDVYGAISLVKRLWHRTYLANEPWGIENVARQIPIPSTWQAANHDPDKLEEDDRDEHDDDYRSYFAILVMDGDQMGKWLSGDKELNVDKDSHRKFSGSLSQFALHEAALIVAKHKGRLIYAGGDDVLAFLPSETAFDCAVELRNKFHSEVKSRMRIEIDASVGIAIAHFKAPLQDVVREAQRAERRAKTELGRGAASVTLLKRSGETLKWGCKWASAGVKLHGAILDALRQGVLSTKFPHRVAERLTPYLVQRSGLGGVRTTPAFATVIDRVVSQEFAVALERQRGRNWQNGGGAFAERASGFLKGYLSSIENECDKSIVEETDERTREEMLARRPETLVLNKLQGLIGLCDTVAFAHRDRHDEPSLREKETP